MHPTDIVGLASGWLRRRALEDPQAAADACEVYVDEGRARITFWVRLPEPPGKKLTEDCPSEALKD